MDEESCAGADGAATPRVRCRAEADLDDCVRVLAEVHAADGYPVNWPHSPGDWLARPTVSFGAWVAVRDGRVVGHVGLSRSVAGDGAATLWSAREGHGTDRTAVVGRLFVDPRARGHGIGALLLDRAVREAGERGLHPVLDVASSGTAAAALYERLGWALLDVVEQRWGPEQVVSVRCYAAPAPPGHQPALPGPPPGTPRPGCGDSRSRH